MKKPFLVWIWTLSCISMAAQSKDDSAVRSLLTAQVGAWNRGSIEEFMKGYWQSDSLIFIGHGGITYGYDPTLLNYKKTYSDTASMGKLFFDLLKVKKLSDGYYFVVGKWFLKRTLGNLSGYYTLLIRKIKGQWRIIADHTS